MIITKLYEFINISDYKKWSKEANIKFYNDMGVAFKKFTNHDKNYNRVYFDLKIDPDRFQIHPPEELKDFMRWFGYPIINYDRGICRDKDGREIKIGKLLTKLGEERLLKTYVDSKQNTLRNTDNLQVVISRHPYDIIGMSSNRGWTTCHDINDNRYDGKHLYGLRNDLKNGILVAYLIKKSDRNINNPISRCTIISKFGKLCPDEHIYGTDIPEFEEFLSGWCGKMINNYGVFEYLD